MNTSVSPHISTIERTACVGVASGRDRAFRAAAGRKQSLLLQGGFGVARVKRTGHRAGVEPCRLDRADCLCRSGLLPRPRLSAWRQVASRACSYRGLRRGVTAPALSLVGSIERTACVGVASGRDRAFRAAAGRKQSLLLQGRGVKRTGHRAGVGPVGLDRADYLCRSGVWPRPRLSAWRQVASRACS